MDRSEVIEDAKAALAGWRDISCAPRDGTDILLFAPTFDVEAGEISPLITIGAWASAWDGEWKGWDVPEADDYIVADDGTTFTHWMPLPPPPSM